MGEVGESKLHLGKQKPKYKKCPKQHPCLSLGLLCEEATLSTILGAIEIFQEDTAIFSTQ
jgi:hypothetical protein